MKKLIILIIYGNSVLLILFVKLLINLQNHWYHGKVKKRSLSVELGMIVTWL